MNIERSHQERLRWRCRRALLELDIVFQRLWQSQGEIALSKREAEALEELLALEDHALWKAICGCYTAEAARFPNKATQELLERLQLLARNRSEFCNEAD